MNILRWLMKHPIMLAWLLAITAILLNFGLGNKAGTAHKEVAQVDAAHQAAPAAAADHGQAPAAATQAAAAPQQQVVATETAPVAAAAAPVATETAAPVTTTATTAPEAAPAVTAAAPVAAVEAPSAPAAAAVATPEAATAPVADANSEADLLRAAREAYWSNEFDNAAGFYTSLLKQTPDSLQYKGELANVFWKQGNSQQAAALFAELAPQLQAQGRSTEANNMRLYVEMVDPALAKTIK